MKKTPLTIGFAHLSDCASLAVAKERGVFEAHGLDEPDSEALVAFLKERIVTYKIPRSFEFTRQRLRDDAGKVRRQQLREDRLTRAAVS